MKAQQALSKNIQVAGFSLIELMVVVGIIGVLATIGIPQYSKFSNRAKQSEAKVALGSIFTSEKSFFVESSTYSPCLQQIGYEATGNQRRYGVGFKTTATTTWTVTGTPFTCSTGNATSFFPNVIGQTSFTNDMLDSPTWGNYTAAQLTFTAGAAANLTNDTAKPDKWTMDDTQSLKNSTIGI
ncbi:MAG: hypothetical protein RJB38_1708 [Pseudomonadota bacterium]